MRAEAALIDKVSRAIADLIKRRAGSSGLNSVTAVKRLCIQEFGIRVRSLILPLDYYGEISGDGDADQSAIILNAAQPIATQLRILFHELAECLAMRGASQFADVCANPLLRATCFCPADLRHQVAVAVEVQLASELGLDKPRSSWRIDELLRLIPLDPKYIQPRIEIEHVHHDVVM